MTPVLVVAVLTATGLLAVWAGAAVATGVPPPRPLLRALLGMQGLLLAQLAWVLVRLVQGDRPVEAGAFTGYAVLSLLLLPGGLALTVDEQTRWGSAVLAIAAVVVAVVELRMVATWS